MSVDITRSDLKTLGQDCKELRVLHMRRCHQVRGLPSSICESSSLKEIDLSGSRLRTLPHGIGKLENLQVLKLKWCKELRELPTSIGNLVQLVELDLCSCHRPKRLPCTLGKLKLLKLLNLSECWQLEAIRAEVGQLTKLESLNLRECTSLHSMCEFDLGMYHLHTLDLYRCFKLKSFKVFGNLYRLQYLDLVNTTIAEEVVAEILRKGYLRTDYLEVLKLSAIPDTALPLCPQLKYLWLKGSVVRQVELSNSFGKSLGNLTKLQQLKLTGVKNLPYSLCKLVELRILHVEDSICERLPEHVGDLLCLGELKLYICRQLVELLLSLGRLSQLRSLVLCYCEKLERLPDSFIGLSQLRLLHLQGCKELERLPDSFVMLTQLSALNLIDCSNLQWKEEGQRAILMQLCGRGCIIWLEHNQ